MLLQVWAKRSERVRARGSDGRNCQGVSVSIHRRHDVCIVAYATIQTQQGFSYSSRSLLRTTRPARRGLLKGAHSAARSSWNKIPLTHYGSRDGEPLPLIAGLQDFGPSSSAGRSARRQQGIVRHCPCPRPCRCSSSAAPASGDGSGGGACAGLCLQGLPAGVAGNDCADVLPQVAKTLRQLSRSA
jgi:hypothetical protein